MPVKKRVVKGKKASGDEEAMDVAGEPAAPKALKKKKPVKRTAEEQDEDAMDVAFTMDEEAPQPVKKRKTEKGFVAKHQTKVSPELAEKVWAGGAAREVFMRIQCNTKSLLKEIVCQKFEDVTSVDHTKSYKLIFVKFASAKALKAAIARGPVPIHGVEVTMEPNKETEGKIQNVGPDLITAVIEEFFALESKVATFGKGLVVKCDEVAGLGAVDKGEVKVHGVAMRFAALGKK